MATPRKRRYAPRLPAEERREQLMDAALRVLGRDGYAKVSIEAIAKEVGVTRPVVYSVFDGLEELLFALLDRTQRRGVERALGIIASAGDPADVDQWILQAADALIDELKAEPDVWRPILGLVRGAPAVVAERIDQSRETIRTYIAGGLAAGFELRGGPALDPDLFSHLVLATAEEFGRLILDEPPRYDKQRLLDELARLLSLLK